MAGAGNTGNTSGTLTAGGFELRGVNHLALVCSDMERTVNFSTNVLGMPLVKTIELPAGTGQHFFFGSVNHVAFDVAHPGVFVRSVSFQDPDGILLEFACRMRGRTPADVGRNR